MHRKLLSGTVAAAVLLSIGASQAASKSTSSDTSEPSIKVKLGKAVHGLIPGQSLRVRGSVTPPPTAATVKLRLFRNGRKVAVSKLLLAGSQFSSTFKISKPGLYKVRIISEAQAGLSSSRSRARFFRASYKNLKLGDRGSKVRYLQRSLRKLGYWVTVNGSYDGATGRAVMAFRKVTGLTRSEMVGKRLWQKIKSGAGHFKLKRKLKGRYVEADLSRQVLVLAKNRRVYKILHTSSGAGSTPTVQGSFRFYSRTPGYNAKRMFYSSFFHRGYAIHGFNPVPAYPASHGCLRIPEANAVAVYNWLRNGDKIFVYP